MPARTTYSPMTPQDGPGAAADSSPYPGDGLSPRNPDASYQNYQATPPQQTTYTPSNTNHSGMNEGNTYSHLGGNVQHSGSSPWLEKQQSANRKSKLLLIGALVGLLAIIAIGVGVGVSLSNKNKSNTSTSGSTGNNTNNPVQQADPNDPSTFQKDSRLLQSFYGLAYSPAGVIYPDCGAQLSDVITDIQLMSQLTKRIRLYGADCNLTALVLEAVKQTKVDLQVTIAIYVVDGDPAAYTRQKSAIQDALTKYDTSHITGITVGNEFMLNYLTARGGGSDPNSAIANQGADALIVNITDTRNMLKTLGLSIPVGNSDAGSYFNTKVLAAVDYGMANVHPWFGNVSVQNGPQWTWDFFDQTDVQPANALPNKPEMSIAEVGWPTASKDAGNSNNGASAASEQNLQSFLDNFVCQTNQKGIKYYFFEFFDEQWKDQLYGGVEGHWGLFYQNKTLKGVTIPNCPI